MSVGRSNLHSLPIAGYRCRSRARGQFHLVPLQPFPALCQFWNRILLPVTGAPSSIVAHKQAKLSPSDGTDDYNDPDEVLMRLGHRATRQLSKL